MCVNAYAFLTPFIQYHYSFSQLVKKVILALYLLYCRKRVTLNFNFSSLFYTLFFFFRRLILMGGSCLLFVIFLLICTSWIQYNYFSNVRLYSHPLVQKQI